MSYNLKPTLQCRAWHSMSNRILLMDTKQRLQKDEQLANLRNKLALVS